MTRNQFIEEVNCWSELIDFCYDYDCDYCEDVYNEDSKNDYFDSELVDYARSAENWQDMLGYLQDIPTGGKRQTNFSRNLLNYRLMIKEDEYGFK